MIVDSTDIDARYQEGRTAHRAGDLDTAARVYEQILTIEPHHAESLHSLGNIRARRGDLAAAEESIRLAIKVKPLGAAYHNSLGDVLAARGLIEDAMAAYEAELSQRPESAVTHNQIGSLLLAEGQWDRAMASFRSALKYAPDFAVAANNLGRACNGARRHEDAIDAFQKAIELCPDMALAHANLGHVLRVTGRGEEAELAFVRALELDATLTAAHRGLGIIMLARGHVRDAAAKFREALSTNPVDARTLRALGDIYLNEGLNQKASEHLERAVEASPDDPDLLCAAAAARRAMGDDEKALELYRRALALRASHQSALAGLAIILADGGDTKSAVARLAPSVNSGRASPELIATYATLLGRLGRRREGISLLENALQKTLGDAIATRLHFALAELLDGDGSYDLAFYHCRRGNNLCHVRFDADEFARQIDAITATHTAESLCAIPTPTQKGGAPIFVVGMPRSGLAVLASVLAVNPSIRTPGASPRIETAVHALWRHAGAKWPDLPADLGVEAVDRLAATAIAATDDGASADTYLLDATWRNCLYLGVISRLYPDARIVECVRDARDTALSCYFFGRKTGKRMPFAYDMNHIAAVVNGYRRLMVHWRNVLGVEIHQVEYEALILDPEHTSQKLAAFLDLPWQPDHFAISRPGENDGSWRLRAKSLRRYRHYRGHLEAFTDALDAPPGEYP